jgi:ABC-type transport system involved in multi-copper enzyme maturation permease subunit
VKGEKLKNPVYVRELMRSMRAPRMILSIYIFNLLLAVVGIFFLNMAMEETVYGSRMDYSVVLMLYQMIACVEWGLTVVMMPALTAGAISGERERNTLELLLTTGMKEISIIWGKLLAALSIMMTLIVSTLPVLSLVFIYGGIRYFGLIQLLAVLLVIAVYVGSICLLFSAFAKTMTFSLISSYAVLLCVIFGTLFASYLLSGTFGVQNAPVTYILLLNPLVTFGAFIYQQVGELEILSGLMGHAGMERYGFFSEHFLELSLLAQLLVSGILLWGATYGLAPSRRLFGTQSSDEGD